MRSTAAQQHSRLYRAALAWPALVHDLVVLAHALAMCRPSAISLHNQALRMYDSCMNQTILTPAQRVRRSEQALKDKGGRRMPSGMLQPDAKQALDDLVAAGYAASPVAAIAAALIDAQRKVKRI